MQEEIGEVKIDYTFYSGQDLYSDGDIEDVILDIVKHDDSYRYTDSRFDNWAILYHLSRQRENIVEPMDIKKTDTLLEIGAGMGAVTGALAQKAKKVTCIDLSKRRSLVNAYRHRNMNNIEIFVGNFEDVEISEKYDVITLIGVLEYAGYYVNAVNADELFLHKIKNLMKPNAKLYIAIENRLGMKYFAGYNEDHLCKPFVGIEGYENSKIKTYSYSELKELLKGSGFENIQFSFPFPDYKLTQCIYDERSILDYEVDFSKENNFDANVTETFDQLEAFKSLRGCEEIKYLANSFLVEATMR